MFYIFCNKNNNQSNSIIAHPNSTLFSGLSPGVIVLLLNLNSAIILAVTPPVNAAEHQLNSKSKYAMQKVNCDLTCRN